uniref:AMMECR1 domain-containing protein n=1 Tax=Fibrocapsa japonica TaxID=94617 RepID=A0A7S2XXU3_9STRA|mmetsp:Transcript_11278/g.16632  ORF Transcript_11278/g.16632 Transcript_11278/m.16632 type:complete len:207 (+) Transcript_11278:205-825(+)
MAEEAKLQATEEMAAYCFDVLIACLKGMEAAAPSFDTSPQCPLFVTWHTQRYSRNGQVERKNLRGCIGTLSAKPISSLQDYTYSSAFRDSRFSPIALVEVPSLHCAVSLLVNYQQATHLQDWEIGVHGILIHFSVGGVEYSGTYLPEVAKEQGWNHMEAIESLIRKAGYRRTITKQVLESVSVTRYQSSKTGVDYRQYCAMRNIQC